MRSDPRLWWSIGIVAGLLVICGCWWWLQHPPTAPPPAAALTPPAPRGLDRPLRLGVIGDSLTLPGSGSWGDSWLRVLIDSGRVTSGSERKDPQVFIGRTWEHAWVASGATTDQALAQGWVDQASAALRSGAVDAVVVAIGIDDLAVFKARFLAGTPVAQSEWDAICAQTENNWLRMAYELQVGRGLVVLCEVPDASVCPKVLELAPLNPALVAQLGTAVKRLNQFIGNLAARQSMPLFPSAQIQWTLSHDPAMVTWGTTVVRPLHAGFGVEYGFAPDGFHIGPISAGVMASQMVAVFNGYAAQIRPLERDEIHTVATSFVNAARTTANP
jgi:hypothetical protein